MTIRLTVDLDGLTWQDLYSLVDAARRAGVPGDQLVGQVPGEQDEDIIVGLAVDVPSLDGTRTVTLSQSDRLSYAQALDAVIAEEGDARAQLGELEALRDTLLDR